MTLRILKLIFLFIVLSPVQDQNVTTVSDQDNSDNKDGDAGSCFVAAMQESNQMFRTGKLNYRKFAKSDLQKESLDLSFGASGSHLNIINVGSSLSSDLNLLGSPRIAFGLLRHCYQSKSSNSLPDPTFTA